MNIRALNHKAFWLSIVVFAVIAMPPRSSFAQNTGTLPALPLKIEASNQKDCPIQITEPYYSGDTHT